MSQQLYQETELRRSPRRRSTKSYSDYFSDDDVLTEEHNNDEDIEEQEDLEEYQDTTDDEYIQEGEQEASDDSSDNDIGSGREQEANEASLKDINHKFTCGICSNILSDPFIIPACCHRFCCKCIQESIKAVDEVCPTCGESVSFQSLRRDEMMGRLLARYKLLQEKIKKKEFKGEKHEAEKNRILKSMGKSETIQTDSILMIETKQLSHLVPRILLKTVVVATANLRKKVHKPNHLVAKRLLQLREARSGKQNLQMMSSLSTNASNVFETSKRNMVMLTFQNIVKTCLVMKDLEDGAPISDGLEREHISDLKIQNSS